MLTQSEFLIQTLAMDLPCGGPQTNKQDKNQANTVHKNTPTGNNYGLLNHN